MYLVKDCVPVDLSQRLLIDDGTEKTVVSVVGEVAPKVRLVLLAGHGGALCFN